MTDLKTQYAPECDDCGLVPLPNSGPGQAIRANLEVLQHPHPAEQAHAMRDEPPQAVGISAAVRFVFGMLITRR